MRIIIAIFLIICRFWVGFKVLSWIVGKAQSPELHQFSEIELYIVIMIFDSWISSSQSEIDVKFIKNDD
jgi:hypothetical protein